MNISLFILYNNMFPNLHTLHTKLDINHDGMGPFTPTSRSPSSSIALNFSCVDHLRACANSQLFLSDPIFFKALSTFPEVFLCYIDVWFLTYGIRAQGLGVSLLHLRHRGIFAITFFLQRFRRRGLEGI
jgi:hypothetical protein